MIIYNFNWGRKNLMFKERKSSLAIVNLFSDFGGGEKYIVEISKELSKKDINVCIITVPNKKLEEELKKQKIEIEVIDQKVMRKKVGLLLWLNKFLKAKNIKHTILNGKKAIYLSIFMSKDIEKIGVIHSFLEKKSLKQRIHNILLQLSSKHIKELITVSEYTESIIKKSIKIKKKIMVVYNGISLNRFSFQEWKKKELKNLVFIGRLDKEKGIFDLINALKILKNNGIILELQIFGEGAYKNEIKRKIEKDNLKNQIKLMGFTNIVNEKMKQSDLLVLPSWREAFPLVNLEAMALGLPVLATKVGGIPELIKDKENGFLVSAASPEELAEKILYIKKNIEKCNEIVLKARTDVEENFNIKTTVSKLLYYLYR